MKSRKFLTLLFIVQLVLCLTFSVSAAENEFAYTVESSDSIVAAGETFTVTVSVSKNSGIALWQSYLKFDTSKISFVKADKSACVFGKDIEVNGRDIANGIVYVTVGSMDNMDGTVKMTETGTVVTFTLKANADLSVDGNLDLFVNTKAKDVVYATGEGTYDPFNDVTKYDLVTSTGEIDVKCTILGLSKDHQHTWADATCTTPKTCTVCTKTEGDALGHDWLDATCTDPKTCKRCDLKEGQAAGHKWNDATCTDPKTCSVCQETEGEALGHQKVTVKGYAATCTTAGKTDGEKCERCQEVLKAQEEIPALGHLNDIKIDKKDATCTDNGYEAGVKCSRCNVVTSGCATIAAKGHVWADANCEIARTCTVCGTTEGEAAGHDWKEATCTEPKTCNVCGATEGDPAGHNWLGATCTDPNTCEGCGLTEGEALGHTEVIIPGKEATCTTSGMTEGKECGRCLTTLLAPEVISAKGHDFAPATCTEPAKCKNCTVTEGAAAGHKFGDWEVTKEATQDAEGEETRKCANCDVTEKRAIEKLPADEFPWIFVVIGMVVVAGVIIVIVVLKNKKKA